MLGSGKVITSGEKRIISAWRNFAKSFPWMGLVLITVGSVLLALGSLTWRLLLVGGVVTLLGLVVQIAYDKTEKVSARRLAELEALLSSTRAKEESLVEGLLSVLEAAARELMDELKSNCGVDFTKSRLSIYRHADDHFYMLTRVSESESLGRKGRSRYPDDQGFISFAWNGKPEGLTDVGLDENQDDWKDTCVNDYGMDRESVDGLTMQSRSFLGKHIQTIELNPKRIGLIVIESLAPRGVNSVTLQKLNNSSVYRNTSALIAATVNCLNEEIYNSRQMEVKAAL
jgi:hypothetical protein